MFSCLRVSQNGGGVLVYIRQSLISDPISLPPVSFERLFININHGGSRIRLLAFYRAPDPTNLTVFLEELDTTLTSCNNKTMIVGDINIGVPNLSARTSPLNAASQTYIDLLTSYGFAVTNAHPTRPASGKTIDHFATNFHDSFQIHNHTLEVDSKLSDHCIVISTVTLESANPRQIDCVSRPHLDFKSLETNFPAMPTTCESSDPNQIADLLTCALQLTIERSTTTTNFVVKHSDRICEWTSSKTLKLLALKDKLLRKRRKKPHSAKIRYELLDVSFALLASSKADYRKFVSKQVSSRDPKKMWRGLNRVLGRGKISEISTVNHPANENPISDVNEIAELFNSYFANCSNANSARNHSATQFVEHESIQSMGLLPPDDGEISNIITLLRGNSAPGHDGIWPSVIKVLKVQIVPILSHLIKSIFTTGIYPSTFKLAIVTPIHKGGSRLTLENYRPISVLPVLNKIVEKVLYKRLNNFFSGHLYDRQFGFRAKANTETAAIEVSSTIIAALDKKRYATGVFMDLKKAFDLVDHVTLLQVLENYGIRGLALNPFRSYLTNRRQVVKIGNALSPEERLNSGVVQGSCLGPLLFLIFINAVGSLPIMGQLFLFADDAVLINEHCNSTEIVSNIQSDMNTIVTFFKQRGMILNASKTNFMLFSPHRAPVTIRNEIEIASDMSIARVKVTKYLGLTINDSFTWIDHVESLSKKLAPAAGVLWKLRNVLPTHSRKIVYDALMQTHLCYLIPVWGFAPSYVLANIQVIQNRALRNVYQLHPRTNRKSMYLHSVETHLPVRGLCILNSATFMYKTLHGNTFTNMRFTRAGDHQTRNLRNSSSLRFSASKTKYGDQAMEVVGPRIYNEIPVNITSMRLPYSFRCALRDHLQNDAFIASCFNKDFFKFKL